MLRLRSGNAAHIQAFSQLVSHNRYKVVTSLLFFVSEHVPIIEPFEASSSQVLAGLTKKPSTCSHSNCRFAQRCRYSIKSDTSVRTAHSVHRVLPSEWAVTWLGFSPRSFGFSTVGFVENEVSLGQVTVPVILFPLSV